MTGRPRPTVNRMNLEYLLMKDKTEITEANLLQNKISQIHDIIDLKFRNGQILIKRMLNFKERHQWP